MKTNIELAARMVSREEWLRARSDLLAREKELTRQWDELRRQRRELPWVKVEENYVFDGPGGTVTLADLFEGRSQLIVQHFMFGPNWKEGCVGCSFKADHVDAALQHIEHHDVKFVAVSRAPIAEIERFKKRMGWQFNWVSSSGNDFNFDYHVSFRKDEIAAGKAYYNYALRDVGGDEGPGNSVFYKDTAGNVFHTYSTYGRGDETLDTTYMYLDLTPKGRNETGPRYNLNDWVRHHDRYDASRIVDKTAPYAEATRSDSPCACGEHQP